MQSVWQAVYQKHHWDLEDVFFPEASHMNAWSKERAEHHFYYFDVIIKDELFWHLRFGEHHTMQRWRWALLQEMGLEVTGQDGVNYHERWKWNLRQFEFKKAVDPVPINYLSRFWGKVLTFCQD